MSITLKFALFTSVLCLSIIAGISYLSYRLAYEDQIHSLGQRLEAIATTAALGIDGDAHDTLHPTTENSAEVFASQAFTSIRDHLRRVKNANGLGQELYTFRRMYGKLDYVVMTHEKPFVDTYEINPAMLPTLNEGKSGHTQIYTDDNGQWMSGYAAVRNSANQVVGMLEVDYQVDEVVKLTQVHFMRVVTKGLGFGLVAVILSFVLARTITRKINHLTTVTERISLGKIDTPIEVRGSDEVARLAAALERMRESLRIAASLID